MTFGELFFAVGGIILILLMYFIFVHCQSIHTRKWLMTLSCEGKRHRYNHFNSKGQKQEVAYFMAHNSIFLN